MRLLFASLVLAAALPVGCQVITGLSSLETTEATGGAGQGGGGQGGGGQGGSAGGDGGGGAPACTSGTVAADCGADTDCRSFSCPRGECVTTDAMLGTSCNDDDGEVCSGRGMCVPASCTDTVQNHGETDVDCGGDNCDDCEDGFDCVSHTDCESGYCNDADECAPTSALGTACLIDEQCTSGHCTEDVCCNTMDCGECHSCALSGDGTCAVTVGADCGDAGDTECDNPDSCDAVGACLDNFEAATTACGSPTEGACQDADTCDGAGNCDPRYHTLGDACCDAGGSTTCNAVGVCGGGACAGNFTCMNEDTCHSSPCTPGECNSGFFCAPMSGCIACGTSPPSPTACTTMPPSCSGTCSGSTCTKTCASEGDCDGATVDAGPRNARLVCNGFCNDTTILCMGPQQCVIDCNTPGSCNNLHVNCSPDGDCQILCGAGSCMGGTTIHCGDRLCSATCGGGAMVVFDNAAGACTANDGC